MGHLGDRVSASHTWAAHSCYRGNLKGGLLFKFGFLNLGQAIPTVEKFLSQFCYTTISSSKNAAGGKLHLILRSGQSCQVGGGGDLL